MCQPRKLQQDVETSMSAVDKDRSMRTAAG